MGVNRVDFGGNTLIDISDSTVTADKLLSGAVAYGADGEKKTGTMTNRGAVSQTLNAGGSYTIPAGYHNGSGKVTANSLASQTSATAAAANILSGKTAWVNGTKITGTISSKAAATITPGTSNQTIAAGQYLSGAQTIAGDANLVSDNIAQGVSIFGVAGNLAAGVKAAYGEVTRTDSSTLTVSGLGFRPSRVFLFGLYAALSSSYSSKTYILAHDSGFTAGSYISFGNTYQSSTKQYLTLGTGDIVTMSDDGFTVSVDDAKMKVASSNMTAMLPATVSYFAIE